MAPSAWCRRSSQVCVWCASGGDGRIAYSVIEDGFEYQGQRHRSLTEIARQITGAHWSGPRFFGVVPKRAKGASAFTRRTRGDAAEAVTHGQL